MNFGNTISFNIFHSVHSGPELEDDDNSDTINSHVPSENDRDDVESGFSPDISDLELYHDHIDSAETLQELAQHEKTALLWCKGSVKLS